MSLAALPDPSILTNPASWDKDAEQAMLGAALTSPAAATEHLTADDWYQPAHATIWQAIQHLRDTGQPYDAITVADHMETHDLLKIAGGRPYLAELVAACTVAANAPAWAAIIRKHAAQRNLQDAAARITQLAHQPTDNPAAILDAARARLEQVTAPQRKTLAQPMSAIMPDLLDTLGTPQAAGIPTPWPDLNKIIGGLAPGTMTVIGGRPGTGKSMLAQNLAAHVADRQQTPVLFVSLEMRAREIAMRRLAAATGIDLKSLHRGTLTTAQDAAVGDAAVRLAESPMWVADDPSQTVSAIRQAVEQLHPGLLIVDYLQLLTPERREQNREREVAEQSRQFKLLAMRYGIPVVVLSQINRGPASRTDKRPELTDLRESGAIENDADVVWLLHHPDPDDTSDLSLHVAKNRNGEAKRLDLLQQGWCARIRSVTRPTWQHSTDEPEEDQ